jgi:serine/threonine protein kinase
LSFLRPGRGDGELGWLGPYRILRVLGRGGVGLVFVAEDPALQRHVALKVMLPQLAADPAEKARFLREAQLAATVEHEHVVQIYQVAEDRGVPFLAMQLLQGESLETRLKREGHVPLVEAARIASETAAGLAAAHARGVIHRDIKPGNIWLEPRGQVKVLDFGLARPIERMSDISRSGDSPGTPACMAPEQARGEKADARADLFSLGCVLYHAITGRQPFARTTVMATLLAVAQEIPPDPSSLVPGVPPALSRLMALLLAKNPAERPGSAAQVARELAKIAVQMSPPVVESPAPVPERGVAGAHPAVTGARRPSSKTTSTVKAKAALTPPPTKRSKYRTLMVIAAIVLIAAGVIALLAMM